MNLARRAGQIQPSQTLAITALVDSLRREGKKIIDLGAGEPDFDTPPVIKEAAIQAIQNGHTKYTPSSGILELRESICEKLKNDNQLDYIPPEIIVTCGAKHAIINVLLALCDEGDEVIFQAPYWTSYVEQIRFVSAKPIILETKEPTEFKIRPEQLEAAITPRTKLFILNSPCNPTGAVYSHSELTAIAEIIEKSGIYFLSDEIYEKITYDDEAHISMASLFDSKNRAIVINGVSKSYAMTGWRIGYVAADQRLSDAMSKIQSHSTSNPCSISQMASLAALKADSSILEEMISTFDCRRRFLVEQLRSLPGVTCNLPKGAFYAFPNVSRYFGLYDEGEVIRNSIDLCSYLLKKTGVALVPGEAFGSRENVRISYATSMNNLKEALAGIAHGLQRLTALN